MSAAFQLSPSGPPAPCGYPKCTLDAFHAGDHDLSRPASEVHKPGVHKEDKRLAFPGPRYGQCVICRAKFVEYGPHALPISRICDEKSCALEFLRRESIGVVTPLMCRCPQRSHGHELSVHKTVRSESYHPNLRNRYPWSLCLSTRLEFSTEKE